MTHGGREGFRPRRLVLPIAVAAGVIGVAPFLGLLRDALLRAFPDTALQILAIGFGTGGGVALLVALWRIRRRRWIRYAGLAVCLGLVAVQLELFATGHPQVDAVERIHILEYGLLAVLFHRAFLPLGGPGVLMLAGLASGLVGILDEWLQWLVPTRVGEVMDVWLNLAATGNGVLFALCVFPLWGFRWRIDGSIRRALALLGIAVVVAFGGFYHNAHLGYEIRDEEERVIFRSWYSPESLPSVAEARGERWRQGSPPSLDPLSLEDHLFVEGTFRVMHRNSSLEHGDVLSAWREQRILELYYPPVLERRGLRSGAPLGLPAEQREELRQAAARFDQALYVSPVLVNRIVLKPSKRTWWIAVAAVAAVLAAVAAWPHAEARSGRRAAGGGRPAS